MGKGFPLVTSLPLFLLAAMLIAGNATSACASSSSADAEFQDPGARYLPLAIGSRWELQSRSAAAPMVLEVTGREGDDFVVRWINPFIQATFRFRLDGPRVVLAGLDMGQGNAPMPQDTVYWDFGRQKGATWKSPVGVGEISERGGRLETPAGTYHDIIEVRTIDQQGQSMYWTFAPDVGLVRWGRGRDAYLLTSVRHGASDNVRDERPADPPVRPSRRDGGSVLIGLDANAHDKSGGGKRGKLAALKQAHEAGMTLLHIAPKWNEFEKSRGRYDFNDDADAVGEFAEQTGLPIALNIRIVDTNQRSMPAAYEGWAFDDERMADRLRDAIRAFPQAYKRQTRYLAIGNEVDGYFGSRANEIAGYATLMRRVRETVRQEFPQAQFTVNFTFGAVDQMSRYRSITDLTDFASLTYYPLNADFTMRPVSELRRDVDRMLAASDGKRLYIQEIGYASAPQLKSSPERQAEFYSTAFDLLRERSDRIVGATFLFMSDLSRFIVEYLGLYYRLPHSGNFKAYLQTLGIIERDGSPKPAWHVFREEALAMKAGR